ncbi:hypothetical protein LPJ75_001909 [Coemansia sp. RSA 2598]|nr:hypothetical protein LPJ75_001909 [Coemansia sp. RSA 2598]
MPRRESMGLPNIRRASQQLHQNPSQSQGQHGQSQHQTPLLPPQPSQPLSQGLARNVDFTSQQRPRPSTARSRLSQGYSGGSLKESHYPGQIPAFQGYSSSNNPYLPMDSSHMSDSRISLLSMVGMPDDALINPDAAAESSRLSLGPAIKNTKSSRALSNEHQVPAETARPRSRTQSSEQGIVTVFSGVQRPPRLDPDLDALNKLPRYRPLVLAPANNRLAGLFQSGPRYIEPTAEQLNLDETELTGMCFSFREYVSDRIQVLCERQTTCVASARRVGMRAADSNTRATQAYQTARQVQEDASVLRGLQRQAERSYELIQDILRDLERLDAALPDNVRSPSLERFPRISRLMAQRRPSNTASPASSVASHRRPPFAVRTTSLTADYFSAPTSPADARVSFDGGALHSAEAASMSLVAAHAGGLRAARGSRGPASATGSLSASATGSMRRPASVVTAVRGDGRGTHSRSEASISRAQAVWSPQISSDSAAFSSSPAGSIAASVGAVSYAAVAAMGTPSSSSAAATAATTGTVPASISTSNTASTTSTPAAAAEDDLLRAGPMSTPVLSPASARALQLRVPRGLSLRSASSAASSLSPCESLLSPTPVGSPQFPAEATRMLRQVILDQPQRRPARSEELPPIEAIPDLPSTARMSTWSASSGRTLADDPRTSKPLASAALSSLTASAAIINRPIRPKSRPRQRPPVDLGLSMSMRSDLERRVRSFSASEAKSELRSAVRPHSSNGFHGSVSRRYNSPYLRLRGEKFNPHRLSLATLSLQDADADNNNDHDDDDAASVSSQVTERLPPTPPSSSSYTSAPTTKRRAQTIAHPN